MVTVMVNVSVCGLMVAINGYSSWLWLIITVNHKIMVNGYG